MQSRTTQAGRDTARAHGDHEQATPAAAPRSAATVAQTLGTAPGWLLPGDGETAAIDSSPRAVAQRARVQAFFAGARTALDHSPRALTQRARTQALFAPATAGAGVVQREGKLKGALLGGLTGAVIGTLLLPVVGTIVGGVIGAVVGASLASPATYKNHQASALESETRTFEQYLQQHQGETDLYLRGAIIPYNSDNARRFNALLKGGMCLYTYDIDGQLTIGTPQDNKHAVVAGGKDVFAAGTASLAYTVEEQDHLQYLEYRRKYQVAVLELEDLAPRCEQVNSEIAKLLPEETSMTRKLDVIPIIREHCPEAEPIYRAWINAVEKVEGYRVELREMRKHINLENPDPREVEGLARPLTLTNDSGHYRPHKDSKSQAFSAWNLAGYSNLIWAEVRTR